MDKERAKSGELKKSWGRGNGAKKRRDYEE